MIDRLKQLIADNLPDRGKKIARTVRTMQKTTNYSIDYFRFEDGVTNEDYTTYHKISGSFQIESSDGEEVCGSFTARRTYYGAEVSVRIANDSRHDTQKEKKMEDVSKISKIAAIANTQATTIAATFRTGDGKDYIFRIPKSEAATLKIGEAVFVEATRDKAQPDLVYVTEIHEESELNVDATFNYRWVIGRINNALVQEMREAEEKLVADYRAAERKKIREQLVAEYFPTALPQAEASEE